MFTVRCDLNLCVPLNCINRSLTWFFSKANTHLPSKSRDLRHPSHAAFPRLSSKFPPKEPPKRDPAFFHIAALQTQKSAQTLGVFPILLTQTVPFPSIFRPEEGTVVTAWRLSNKILPGSFCSHKCTAFIYISTFPSFIFLLHKKSTFPASAKIWTKVPVGFATETGRKVDRQMDLLTN